MKCGTSIVRLRKPSSRAHASRALREFSELSTKVLKDFKKTLFTCRNIASFFIKAHFVPTMNMKTDDFEIGSEDDNPDVPNTVVAGSLEGDPRDDGNPETTQEEAHGTPLLHLFGVSKDSREMRRRRRSLTSTQPQSDDWIDVNTPSRPSEQLESQYLHRSARQRQIRLLVDSYAKVANSTRDPTELITSYYESLIETYEAERDSAESRYQEAKAAACEESERHCEEIHLANIAAESARDQVEREMERLKEKTSQEYEEMKSSRDTALKDLSEVKAQLAAIEMRESNSPPCQSCRSLDEEVLRLRFMNKDLKTDEEHLARELEIAQGSVAAYKNSFAITHKILNEQQAEIAEQKVKIAGQKSEVSRLNTKLAELQTLPESTSVIAGEEEDAHAESIEHTEAPEPCTSGQPLVMRIVVWVGGEDGTDTELALVKMNPDTQFKAILEDLRHHHPRMALKQKNTERYIFDSDTPAYVSNLSLF
jgi:hypothetical protein